VAAQRFVCDAVSAQLYETKGGGRALVASRALAQDWAQRGLVEEGAGSWCTLGSDQYLVVLSNDRTLSPVAECAPPSSLSEALAFVAALRRTRQSLPTGSLEDSIYCESLSVLLPLSIESTGASDDVLVGRYLSGGVSVSCRSVRRLHALLPRFSEADLIKVAAAAGTPAPAEGAAASPGGEAKPAFSLPGRPDLERFFREHVVDIIDNAERYRALGIDFPPAVVLQGPPGCGKTFAVEKLIEYLGWPSFSIDSSSVGSKYIHETGRLIAKVFEDSITSAPSVVVIDEMESFLADRERGGDHRIEELAEFLRRVPEAIQRRVLVIGMTNRVDLIDPAILRRGRFDHIVEVGMPTAQEVNNLIHTLLGERRHGEDVDAEALGLRLAGRPLADVGFLLREAARIAARSGKDHLDRASLEAALEAVLSRPAPGAPRRPIGFLGRE